MPRIFPRPLLFLPLIVLILLLSGAWLLFKDAPPEPSSPGVRSGAQSDFLNSLQGGVLPPGTETTVALRAAVPAWIEAVGEIRPRVEIAVSAQVQAEVRRVLVRPGQRIRRGETLLELDDRELQSRLAQGRHDLEALGSALKRAHQGQEKAQAGFDLAQSDFARIEALHAQGASAAQELDHARAAFLAARAESGQAGQSIQELEAQQSRLEQRIQELTVALGHTSITASEEGIIARRSVEPGDVVQPGRTLLLLHSPDSRLEVQVPERFHQMMTVGTGFTARVDALDREFPVVVDEVEPLAATDSRTFLVKLVPASPPPADAALPRTTDIPDTNPRPGMFVRLHIPMPAQPMVLVDSRAVLRIGQLELAAVVHDDSTYILRHLRLGRVHDDQVEVLSGLDGGERLWLHPAPGS
ncbi:RND family efflux transporter, MFP subunit [Desulfonatronum zhilinae]|nr:RND family efflux transporter, MFP subunit [Desulfonatronum zhilinae]